MIVGIILVVLIIGAVAANSGKGNQATTTSTNQNPTTPAAQATTAPASTAHKVGDVVTIDGWMVTVNGVKTSSGDDFSQPKAGNTFLLIDITIVNNTGQSQAFSSLLALTLKDSTGQKYGETIVANAPSTPDGNIANGSKLRGTVAYEIPASAHTLAFDFTPDITSTDVATWNLTI